MPEAIIVGEVTQVFKLKPRLWEVLLYILLLLLWLLLWKLRRTVGSWVARLDPLILSRQFRRCISSWWPVHMAIMFFCGCGSAGAVSAWAWCSVLLCVKKRPYWNLGIWWLMWVFVTV